MADHNPRRDVTEFLLRIGYPVSEKPRTLSREELINRVILMQEELTEYRHSQNQLWTLLNDPRGVDEAEVTHLLAEAQDALVDLLYTVWGTIITSGFVNLEEGWDRVHKANMMKHPWMGPGLSPRGLLVDAIKPPGWESPRHDDLVEDHAHRSGE